MIAMVLAGKKKLFVKLVVVINESKSSKNLLNPIISSTTFLITSCAFLSKGQFPYNSDEFILVSIIFE